MSRRLELNFDDWLERYDVNKQENNTYKPSFKKLNEKIEANNLLLKSKQKKIS
jgi:hypothetical protein